MSKIKKTVDLEDAIVSSVLQQNLIKKFDLNKKDGFLRSKPTFSSANNNQKTVISTYCLPLPPLAIRRKERRNVNVTGTETSSERVNEIVNGMQGMQRDVLLRLCKLFWASPQKIRAIFGMCREYYEWKKHKYFSEGRPINIPMIFLPSARDGYTLVRTSNGENFCTFTKDCQSVFVRKPITEGVFRWTVRFSYTALDYSCCYLGCSRSDSLSQFDHSTLNIPGGCCFMFRKDLHTFLCRVENKQDIPVMETSVPDQTPVSVELDAAAATVSFFVGETKVPRTIGSVPLPMNLGASGHRGQSFASVSFRRLPGSTPSAVRCTLHRYFGKEA